MPTLKSLLKSLRGIDLAEMDREIAHQEQELARIKATRTALAQIQEATGADGSDPMRSPGGTILDRVKQYLEGGKEATAAEIAAAIGASRGATYVTIRKHQEVFRQKDKRWRLK
jgi:hypothetical protein